MNNVGYIHLTGPKIGGWCKNNKVLTSSKQKRPLELYPYQFKAGKEVIETIINQKIAILLGPSAAGKTLISDYATDYIQRMYPNVKSIQAVPQTMSGEGFAFQSYIDPITGETITHCPQYNLCESNGNIESKTKELIERLMAPSSKTMAGRQFVCSHSVLAKLLAKITNGELPPSILRDTIVNPDESHHGLWGVNENGDHTTNRIGMLTRLAYENPQLSILPLLTTASFIRANRNTIVPEDILANDCVITKIPWDVFMPYTGINQFSMDYWLYENGLYLPPLKELLADHTKHTIVYIDPAGGKGKYRYVDNVFKAFAQNDNPTIKYDNQTGLTYVNGEAVMDLVQVDGQLDLGNKIDTIFANHKSDKPLFKMMVTLHRGKEAFNNRHLVRAILVNPRQSPVDIVQIPGRLFRAADNKSFVEIHTLIGYNPKHTGEEYKENINDFQNVQLGYMLMEQLMAPKLIPMPRNRQQSYVDEAFSDEHDKRDMIARTEELLIEAANDDGDVDTSVVKDKLKEILTFKGITEHVEEICQELIAIVRRHYAAQSISSGKAGKHDAKMLKVKGFLDIDLWRQDYIDMPTINIKNIKEGYGGLFGIETFRELKAVFDSLEERWFLRLDEAMLFLKKYKRWPGKEDGVIGQWVDTQRKMFQENELRKDRELLLRKAGLKLERVFCHRDYEEVYEMAKRYYKEFGNLTKIPKNHPEYPELYKSLIRVRTKYHNEELSPDEVKKFEKIGMIWDKYEDIWMQHYKISKTQYEEVGYVYVQRNNKDTHSHWFRRNQKAMQGKGRTKLTAKRKQLLKDINFISDSVEWKAQQKIDALKSYIKEYKTNIVPQKYVTKDGILLGQYVSNCIYIMNKWKTTRPHWYKQLIALGIKPGFVRGSKNRYGPQPRKLIQRLKELDEYKEQFGDCDVPQNYKNQALAWFVVRNRQRNRKGTINLELKQLLDDKGFNWNGKKGRPS